MIKYIILILLASVVSLNANQAQAADFYNVQLVRVYDGDTITVNLPDIHPLLGDSIGVRVAWIDTPEIRGKCPKEKRMALEARDLVRERLAEAPIILTGCKRGKYFRLVCDVNFNALADELSIKGLAVPYNGGTKTKDWCK